MHVLKWVYVPLQALVLNSTAQCSPLELSVMVEIVYICTVQYDSH